MSLEKDPRATQIYKQSEQSQQKTQYLLNQLKTKKNINAFLILSTALDYPQIKDEPDLAQIMFNSHLNVVTELIQWMLLPKSLIMKKKIKTDVSSYPFQCRQFLKDNKYFYQYFYLNARKKIIQFDLFFTFLRKDNFHKQTIFTALGYFADVMIPFAKYDFSGSYDIKNGLKNHGNACEQSYSIFSIISQNLIEQILNYCYYEPIFQFLITIIVQNIQSHLEREKSKSILNKILKKLSANQIFSMFPIHSVEVGEYLSKTNEFLQNFYRFLCTILQQLSQNPQQLTIYLDSLIITILKSQFIQFCITQLLQSRLYISKSYSKMYKSDEIIFKKTQQSKLQGSTNFYLGSSTNYGNRSSEDDVMLPSMGSFGQISDGQQQEIIQTILKILSTFVEIYQYIQQQFYQIQQKSQQVKEKRKKYPIPTSPLSRSQRNSNYKKKQYIKQIIEQNLSQLFHLFRSQLQLIFDSLQLLNKFVYNSSTEGQGEGISYAKILPFSSGQNIKIISSMKYQYLKLLWDNISFEQQKNKKQCKSYPGIKFSLKIQKLYIIQIVKKYLSQNKWNNLCHHLLEKICHEIIVNNYCYIKKHIEKDKNKTFLNSFLAFLIQNFTKRDFVFLNTVKFTNQGNVYSLYKISKDLAFTLNVTNQLIVLLNQFKPWNKFITEDLKLYEQQIFPKSIKPQYQENDSFNQSYTIKIDQAQSIKKLVQNIANIKKRVHNSLKLPLKIKNNQKFIQQDLMYQDEQEQLMVEIKKQKSANVNVTQRKIKAEKEFQEYLNNLESLTGNQKEDKKQINGKHKLTTNRYFSLMKQHENDQGIQD